MPRIRVNTGPFPAGVTRALLEMRGSPAESWTRLGEVTTPVSYWTVLQDGPFEVRARMRDATTRRLGPARTALYAPQPVQNRTPMAALAPPAAAVNAEPDRIVVRQEVPADEDPDEYFVDVRIGPEGGAPKDAVHVGFGEVGGEIAAERPPSETTADVHVRVVRDEDLEHGPWETVTIQVPPNPEYVELEDHAGDFTGGTIKNVVGAPPLETVGGGGIRHKPIHVVDADIDVVDADWFVMDADCYWGVAEYVHPIVEETVVHDFLLAFGIDVGTLDREDEDVVDAVDAVCEDRVRPDGRDNRLWLLNRAVVGDETPVVVEHDVEVSQTHSTDPGGHVFAAAVRHRPSARYRGKAYRATTRIYTWFGRRVTIDAVRTVRRMLNRKVEFSVPVSYPTASGRVEISFSPDPGFISIPKATVTVQSAASTFAAIIPTITSLGKTAMVVELRDVDGNAPAATDLSLHVHLLGY